MKSNRQFVIPFKGLKVGRHDFFFEIDDRFFDDFADSEIKRGNAQVEVYLNKKVNMLEFDFKIKGDIWAICDRCLEEFLLPVAYSAKLFVKFGEINEEQTDEIISLSHNEFEFDTSQYIYEYIHLSLPYRRIHPENKNGKSSCNKEMLNKLNEYIIREHEKETDPRWDNLKDIFLNNN